jgi:hypothetical protein
MTARYSAPTPNTFGRTAHHHPPDTEDGCPLGKSPATGRSESPFPLLKPYLEHEL